MNMRWSLDELYSGFETEKFRVDIEKYKNAVYDFKAWAEKELVNGDMAKEKIEYYLNKVNELSDLIDRLYNYSLLTVSVDAKNEAALKMIEKLELLNTELTEPSVSFQKWLDSLKDLDNIITSSELLQEHRFHLMEIVEQTKYLLSENEEIIISKMKNTGSSAWSRLQELLTSTLLVDIELNGEKKQLPLSVVRNMAYDNDKELRKQAYYAELEAYKKVEDSSAACLNGIKGEVISINEMRGYDSPLQQTLIDSRMDEQILDAMLSAIEESLPVFQRFYRKKAELLGHENGLPFYDLYAPVGSVNKTYTYEDASAFIVKNFRTFSNKLGNYADNAFKKRWIDAEPREGKRGGAFCVNLHSIKESRILANYSENFNDVLTLAHELGHGYHGACLMEETHINSNYPMPIAETASIFSESIVKSAAIQEASEEEAFVILENDISDFGQVIVDIYSRFVFEKELFKLREDGSLSVEELKDLMIKAQKTAYGNGLDHNYLHPYMWLNKTHYYDADYNYYNFPYAFGLLFSKGLYAEYLSKGESFVKEYDKLLSVTGKLDLADIAKIMGINIRSKEFWQNSLKLIEQDIELFIVLANKLI